MKKHQTVQEEAEGLDLLWRTVSSSGFSLGVLCGWALWFFAATQVPQGASPEQVMNRYTFGVAEAILGLRLHQALSSWVLIFLLALTCVAFVARLIENGARGKLRAYQEIKLPPQTPAELGTWIRETLGIRRWGEEGGHLRGVRGYFLEASVCTLFSLFLLGTAQYLGWNAPQAEFLLVPPKVEGETRWSVESIRVPADDGWVAGELPFIVQCDSEPDSPPVCVIASGDKRSEGTLEPGQNLHWGGGVLRVAGHEAVGSGEISLEASATGQGDAVVMDVVPGKAYQLRSPQASADRQDLRLILRNSAGGPVGTLQNEENGTVVVLTPFPGRTDATLPLTLKGREKSAYRVIWNANQGMSLLILFAAVGIIGLVLMLGIPHLRMQAVLMEDGGYLVKLMSLNRPHAPARICDSLGKREGGA